jgi:hypothetical protein
LLAKANILVFNWFISAELVIVPLTAKLVLYIGHMYAPGLPEQHQPAQVKDCIHE